MGLTFLRAGDTYRLGVATGMTRTAYAPMSARAISRALYSQSAAT